MIAKTLAVAGVVATVLFAVAAAMHGEDEAVLVALVGIPMVCWMVDSSRM